MKRVTRPGGCMCAFAEPDYAGRIAFPEKLANAADLQTQSLTQQGINPGIGRELAHLFTKAGLKRVQAGVLAAEWKDSTGNLESEVELINSDLAFLKGKNNPIKKFHMSQFPPDSIYFIPTFYACGRVD